MWVPQSQSRLRSALHGRGAQFPRRAERATNQLASTEIDRSQVLCTLVYAPPLPRPYPSTPIQEPRYQLGGDFDGVASVCGKQGAKLNTPRAARGNDYVKGYPAHAPWHAKNKKNKKIQAHAGAKHRTHTCRACKHRNRTKQASPDNPSRRVGGAGLHPANKNRDPEWRGPPVLQPGPPTKTTLVSNSDSKQPPTSSREPGRFSERLPHHSGPHAAPPVVLSSLDALRSAPTTP
eukprot:1187165-Prorocentrum_minimum.AAC.3